MANTSFLATISLILLFFFFKFNISKAQKLVPAVYVFGDSLVDVGNNNFLPISVAKANFQHNGIDFPTKRPTGRFSNGKNLADFIAEKVGLPTSPPYLSPQVKNNATSFLTGVSFASGGAGILEGSDHLFGQALPLSNQVNFYALVHKDLVNRLQPSGAQSHLAKSLFLIVIGSNDLLDYYGRVGGIRRKAFTPQEYVDRMASKIKLQLTRLYDLGARKFAVNGVGEIGCIPAVRVRNPNEECNNEQNHWSTEYNTRLQRVLNELKSEKQGFKFSYFDTFNFMRDSFANPAAFGFTETKKACCGLGKLNANVPCLPIAQHCGNRRAYVFWDLYHPTEAASGLFADNIFENAKYTTPINVRELVALVP